MDKLEHCKERGLIVRLENGASYKASQRDIRRLGQPEEEEEEEEEEPCPDDDNYECYSCGEPTGRGYDSGQCCQCLGE